MLGYRREAKWPENEFKFELILYYMSTKVASSDKYIRTDNMPMLSTTAHHVP